MNVFSRMNFMAALAAAMLLVAMPAATQAQTGDDQWANWWYGIFLGGNVNLFSGQLEALFTTNDVGVALPNGFDEGMGFGLTGGAILEYNSGDLLGGNVMVGYDNRSVTFDRKNPAEDISIPNNRHNEDLVTSLAYIAIEPNLRLNLGSRFFHLLVGPSFKINVAKSYTYEFNPNSTLPRETHEADLAEVRSFVIGGQAGLGYDIPLTDASASTQMLLTPFAQFHLSQQLIEPVTGSPNEYKLNTIRAGVQLKFGSRPVAAPPPDITGPAGDFSVRAPSAITESRRLNETFPLRNYIFFDPGSTNLPARYTKLSSGDAAAFREEQLVKPSVSTGNEEAMRVRSNRQMEVYYNVMNVFADRMRRNPSANIRLVGSANGDAAAGKQMAENVKNYMVSTFGIEADRIKAEGSPMPAHKSGSGTSTGEDKKLIDAENYRVEIIATPNDIMKPVQITSIQEEPIDNDVVLALPNVENVDQWNVTITDNTGKAMNYGPYRFTTVARIDSKELLGSRNEGRFTAKIDAKLKNGQTQSLGQKEFRLVRDDSDEEQTGTRYSILFEFDESKTVQTYDQFLSETVAPNIPNGASVIIHGHTDVTGDPDYNAKLSQRRSDEAQKILTRELNKAGKKVTFDTYGFGEDENRSPFNNTLPEQRYYNRTVVVEVVPGR